jgi:hypothetical protein
MIELADEIREDVIDGELELRLHTVSTVRRTWSGGAKGRGSVEEEETILSPKPKVSSPSLRLLIAVPGKFLDGDVLVTRISVALEEGDLTGGSLGEDEEFFWRIDGRPYRVVGLPEQRYLEWRVQLRPMNARSAPLQEP